MSAQDAAQSLPSVDLTRETAAQWHTRMTREKISDDTRAEFHEWLEQAPENRAAYEALERTLQRAQLCAHAPEILALRHETALRLQRRNARPSRIPLWAVAASVFVLATAVMTFVSWPTLESTLQLAFEREAPTSTPAANVDGRYATAVGERLAVSLDDGSLVTLNTHTRLQRLFTATERRIILTQGQALFEVAKDPARPFIVEANGRRVIAVGTAFDVRVDREQMQVTMLEGTVRVEQAPVSAPAGQGAPPPTREKPRTPPTLTAGDQLTITDERADRIRVADPERVTSWRRGQLIFENTRLADAIEEINRYSATQLALGDASLADLRISGAFATGRPAVFVDAMTRYFPITVIRQGNGTLSLSKRGSPTDP